MNRVFSRLGLTAIAIVAGSALHAQGTQTGNLVGVVKEASTNKPIAGARLVVHTPQGDFTTTTNAQGAFRLVGLIPGNVSLSVSADGYMGGNLSTHVALDNTNVTDFVLKPSTEANATVVVVGSANNIDTTDAKDGKNFTLSAINALPILNRTVGNIAALSPGISRDNNGLTIRGAQNTQVLYLVDGADVSDPVTGGNSAQLNEDMLSEVQVQSGGISAEYGRFTGGVVQAVTKSGGNEFSGIVRLTAEDPNWNAYNPLDRTLTGTRQFTDTHTVTQNYVFSGPIIKDHLFFVVGFRQRAPFVNSVSRQTTAPVIYGGGIPYNATASDERKDIKLDWQITPNHRVFWQYNATEQDQTGRDYANAFFGGSTSLATLSNQPNAFSYYTLGYQGLLSDNFVLNIHYSHKKETLGGKGGGGQGGSALSMYDQVDNYLYDNGVFGEDGDSRPIENGNIAATWFLHGAGEHELKFGVDWYQSSHTAANAQSPSGVFVYFNGFIAPVLSPADTALSNRNFVVGSGGSGSFWDEWRTFGAARSQNTIWSGYINDKWRLNSHWSFNIGARLDKFTSKTDLGANNFSLTAISPRLAAIWDINGDGTWILQGSYGVYTGAVIQGATDSTSVVGNPAEYDFDYTGGPGNLRSSYAATPFFVNDPGKYRHSNLFDPNAKMPEMQETAITLKHADGESGIWSVNINRRHWKNFLDDFKTAQPNPVDANDLSLTVTKNDPTLVRDYLGFEFQYQKQFTEAFSSGGNLTLSSLRGNYEGGQVGTTEQINNFGPVGGTPGAYPGAPTRDQLGNYGYLAADVPIRIRAFSNYTRKIGPGHLNVGAIFNYTAGAPYSKTARNAPVNGVPSYIGGGTYTEFFGDRGAQRFADTYSTDLQLAYDMPIWRRFNFFTVLNITNVFNHQMQQTWNTSGTSVSAGTVWRPANAFYGKPTSAADYIAARTIQLSAGIKF